MRRTLLAPLLVGLLAPAAALAQPDVAFSPFDDPEARALALLDEAESEVVIAHYNIRNEVFFEKLSELRARGVRVRIAVDAKNAAKPYNTLDDRFVAAGFDFTRYENTGSAYAIMHHKFTVIDGKTVLTGSYNWNETAQLVNDENMLVLRDPLLAAAYLEEFEELMGAPERRGPGVGQAATVYFSPEDRVRDVILEELGKAQRKVLVAMFTFSDTAIARALKAAADRGVEVLLVTEKKQADRTRADERVAEGGLGLGGFPARVIVGANTSSAFSAMHQKYCVIDDEVVITGACNWTYTAFRYSNEDVLVVRDPALAARYTENVGALVRRYAPEQFDPAAFGIARSEAGLNLVAECGATFLGEAVYLVGEHPALGGWDLARAIPLRTSESMYPVWAGRVTLPAGARAEYKLVIMGGDRVVWETGENRVLETDPAGADAFLKVRFRDGSAPPADPAPDAPAPATPDAVGSHGDGAGLTGALPSVADEE